MLMVIIQINSNYYLKYIAVVEQLDTILETFARLTNISLGMLDIIHKTLGNIPQPLQEDSVLWAVFCVPQLQGD